MDEAVMKKMVEVWIDQHTLKVGRATVIDARIGCPEGFNGMYHNTNYNAVVYVDGDDIYEGVKKALKVYKAHCRAINRLHQR